MEKGKIYGLLGPNGAGKSTTMNMMTGYIGATSGEVKINGFEIFMDSKKAKAQIGYLPEIPPLYPDMTVNEYLMFVADLKKVPRKERKDTVQKVCEKTGLVQEKNRLIRKLSKGYRQRVGLAQAIMGDPEILILDEPTVGLDPIQIKEFNQLLLDMKNDHIILISSHILSEIEEISDHIFMIAHGRLVLSDSTIAITSQFTGSKKVSVSVKGDQEEITLAVQALPCVSTVEFDSENRGIGKYIITSVDMHDIREEVSGVLGSMGFPIYEMQLVEQSLEDIFMDKIENYKDEDEDDDEDLDDVENIVDKKSNKRVRTSGEARTGVRVLLVRRSVQNGSLAASDSVRTPSFVSVGSTVTVNVRISRRSPISPRSSNTDKLEVNAPRVAFRNAGSSHSDT